jgi:hypothetical protein
MNSRTYALSNRDPVPIFKHDGWFVVRTGIMLVGKFSQLPTNEFVGL